MQKDFENYFDGYYYDIFCKALLYNITSHKEILRIYGQYVKWNDFRSIKILGYEFNDFSNEYMIKSIKINNESEIDEFTFFGLIENDSYKNIEDDFLQQVLIKSNLDSFIMLGIFVSSFDKLNPNNTFKNNSSIFIKKDPGITIKELGELFKKIKANKNNT